MGETVHLELTDDEALVLFEFLARCEVNESLPFDHRAEERAMRKLQGQLEKQLVPIFDPNYDSLVEAARGRLRDPVE